MEALGLNLGYILVQIGSFVILFLVLAAWAYKPILGMLEKRSAKIAQGLEDARIAGEARANAEQEAAKIVADAQSKAGQIVREASERAELAARDIKASAEADAAKAREIALAEVEGERERILSDLRGQVGALAIAAAQKLIGVSLDEARQRALINEFFSGVKAGRMTVLEGMALSGASADVTSALPLTSEEKEVVKRDVLSKIGPQATITFRVDPGILGGLVIRAGGKVLDASVAGQLGSLKQSLM